MVTSTKYPMTVSWGRVHPKGEPDQDASKTLFYTQSQLQELAVELIGKPLLIEHDERYPVGSVLHSWTTHDGCYALFETDKRTTGGKVAAQLLDTGLYAELSLGHRAQVDPTTYEVGTKEAKELSIVMKGAREGTDIYAARKGALGDLKNARDTLQGVHALQRTIQTQRVGVDASKFDIKIEEQSPAIIETLIQAQRRIDTNNTLALNAANDAERMTAQQNELAEDLGIVHATKDSCPPDEIQQPETPAIVNVLKLAEKRIMQNNLRTEAAALVTERLTSDKNQISSMLA